MLADPEMNRRIYLLIHLLTTFAAAASQGNQTVIATGGLTPYTTLIQRTLPCPDLPPRRPSEFQLCLWILPPGHRVDERELLIIFSRKGDDSTLTLVRPTRSLSQASMSASGAADEITVDSVSVKDARKLHRIVKGWTELRLPVVPLDDWYTDATTYRFESRALTGSVDAELYGPGRSEKHQPTPLLEWAERVRAEAEKLFATP